MFVQIFASSAWTGVVCTIGAPKISNSCADALARRASPTPPTMHGSVSISSKKRPAAMRSGAWATKTSSPTCEAAVLGEVAGDEVGRARRDRRAQHDRVARAQVRRAGRRAPSGCRGMSISMCENDGVPSVMTMCSARAASATRVGQLEAAGGVHAVERLLRARLLEGHAARRARPPGAPGRCRRRARSGRGRRTRGRAAGRSGPRPMTETSMVTSGRLAVVGAGTQRLRAYCRAKPATKRGL